MKKKKQVQIKLSPNLILVLLIFKKKNVYTSFFYKLSPSLYNILGRPKGHNLDIIVNGARSLQYIYIYISFNDKSVLIPRELETSLGGERELSTPSTLILPMAGPII